MADLVIRGMRIPPQCVLYDEYRVIYYKCPFADEGKWGVLVCTCPNQKRGARIVNDYTETRHPDCPLLPLPEGHGRLIDADALQAKFEVMENALAEHGRPYSFAFKDGGEMCAEWWTVQDALSREPTIVPAEGVTDNG